MDTGRDFVLKKESAETLHGLCCMPMHVLSLAGK